MAVTRNQENEAFFREVDEEVRRERMERFARRYGIIIAVLVILALAAFGGALWWNSHRDALAGQRAEKFDAAMSALTGGKQDDARKSFEALAASGAKGYAPLSKVMLADMAIQDGKDADAAKQFMQVAQDEKVARPIRDLALVRATAIDFDNLKPADVVNRLKPLAVPGNPWFGSAGEMTGLAYMKLNQPKKAGAVFASITRDKTVPDSIRGRAAQLAGDLGFDAVQPGDSARP